MKYLGNVSLPIGEFKENEKLILIDVSQIPAQPYEMVAIYRSNQDTNIYDIIDQLDNEFSGCILIDAIVQNGDKEKRFVELQIEDGKHESTSIRTHAPHPAILELCNVIVQHDPDIQALLNKQND